LAPQPTPPTTTSSAPQSSDPAPGSVKYEDGKEYGWLPSFGWVEYSGPSIVTYAEDMYENGNKIGIMGGDDSSAPRRSSAPQTEEPAFTGEVTEQSNKPEGYVTPTKDSTPPPLPPNTICQYEQN
jgi:hypothetical protein